MSEKKEKAPPVHALKRCVGGPLAGKKLRVYADNPGEVRRGKKMEFTTPVPFSGGRYYVQGNELHWESTS